MVLWRKPHKILLGLVAFNVLKQNTNTSTCECDMSTLRGLLQVLVGVTCQHLKGCYRYLFFAQVLRYRLSFYTLFAVIFLLKQICQR